jgi:DNA polymerase III delta prime subunit
MSKIFSTDDHLVGSEDIVLDPIILNQVLGQDEIVSIARLAIEQKRHLLLIGPPGVGKSMIGKGIAYLQQNQDLFDLVSFPNFEDPNKPIVKQIKAGLGEGIVKEYRLRVRRKFLFRRTVSFILPFLSIVLLLNSLLNSTFILSDFYLLGLFLVTFGFYLRSDQSNESKTIPELLYRAPKKTPFIEVSAAGSAKLFGTVKHDPYQSGGLETPPHKRIDVGAIHQGNLGILFIDEIASLDYKDQLRLLTVIQEKEYPVSGKESSSSAEIVTTNNIPCQFQLIAAGNDEALDHLHPAFISRLSGMGFILFMNRTMDDNKENQMLINKFISQEVNKENGNIPHFSKEGVISIINISRLLAPELMKLSLQLRVLGGIIRTAGDIAKINKKNLVNDQEVIEAFEIHQNQSNKPFLKHPLGIYDSEFKNNKFRSLSIIIPGQESNSIENIIKVHIERKKIEEKQNYNLKIIGFEKMQNEMINEEIALFLNSINFQLKCDITISITNIPNSEEIKITNLKFSIILGIFLAHNNLIESDVFFCFGEIDEKGDLYPIDYSLKRLLNLKESIARIFLPKHDELEFFASKYGINNISFIKNILEVN